MSAPGRLLGAVRRAVRALGWDVVRYPPPLPADLDPATRATIAAVQPFTLTSPERIAALCDATRHLARLRLPGAIVECGVWRGGSMMAVARTLLEMGDRQRELFLFDTFSGMTEPGAEDVAHDGVAAAAQLRASRPDDPSSLWCRAPLAEVEANLAAVGYPAERLHFVVGRVEDTLPARAPASLALLRLDTDWYASTRHELVHLFPRLAPGGILIVDDYGHWRGARQAVDEYLREQQVPLLLQRIDFAGRLAIVPPR